MGGLFHFAVSGLDGEGWDKMQSGSRQMLFPLTN